MARRHGVRVAICTDAHEATQFNFMRWGVATARRGWMGVDDVINAQPLDVLRTWLKRARA
jgi:DNA polymerase (family 10)